MGVDGEKLTCVVIQDQLIVSLGQVQGGEVSAAGKGCKQVFRTWQRVLVEVERWVDGNFVVIADMYVHDRHALALSRWVLPSHYGPPASILQPSLACLGLEGRAKLVCVIPVRESLICIGLQVYTVNLFMLSLPISFSGQVITTSSWVLPSMSKNFVGTMQDEPGFD